MLVIVSGTRRRVQQHSAQKTLHCRGQIRLHRSMKTCRAEPVEDVRTAATATGRRRKRPEEVPAEETHPRRIVWAADQAPPPPPALKQEAPTDGPLAELIKVLVASGRLGHKLCLSQYRSGYTIINLDFNCLVDLLAARTGRGLDKVLSRGGFAHIKDVEARV